MKTKTIHISQVRVGDVILHENTIKTLSAQYLKKNGFMNTSIWGDSYELGTKPVIKFIWDKS